jgi:hypothetical protein
LAHCSTIPSPKISLKNAGLGGCIPPSPCIRHCTCPDNGFFRRLLATGDGGKMSSGAFTCMLLTNGERCRHEVKKRLMWHRF